MLTRRSARIVLCPIAMGAAVLGVAGCGGISAGDHIFYRLAFEATDSSPGCFPNEMIPDSVKDDTTSVRGGATFIVYAPSNEDLSLDTGSMVLDGEVTDTGYQFSGTTVDVTNPVGDTVKLTTTTKISVDMTVSGATVEGTMKTVTDSTCEGSACSGNPEAPCTRTNKFRGIAIDQADVGLGGDVSPNGR